ncbi:unnamed protein product, partial [Discosporangium mesarthrocarpum]
GKGGNSGKGKSGDGVMTLSDGKGKGKGKEKGKGKRRATEEMVTPVRGGAGDRQRSRFVTVPECHPWGEAVAAKPCGAGELVEGGDSSV